MLKISHKNTGVSYCNTPLLFDLPNERYTEYLIATISSDSSNKLAESLRNALKSEADNKGVSYEEILRDLLSYKVRYWQFNYTLGRDTILKELRRDLHKAISKKKTSSMPIDDREMIQLNGENVSIEDINRLMYTPKNTLELAADYKDYFYGIYYVAKKVVNTFDQSSVIRVLYCKWLHMINDKTEGFLINGMVTGDYSNSKKPNAIVGQYSNNSGRTEEDIDSYTREYLDTHDKKDISENEFYKDLYTIFTQILGFKILDPDKKYQSREVDEEYTNLYKTDLMSEKFSLNFLNKTQSIYNWKELSVEDVENEYNISEFTDLSVSIPKEIPPLRPVLSFPVEKLENDKDFMRMLHLRYKMGTTRTSGIYNGLYTSRLVKLRNDADTHEIYRNIRKSQENDDKEIFNSEAEKHLNLNINNLPERLLRFELEYPDAMKHDDMTTEILNSVKFQLSVVTKSLYTKFKTSNFNCKEMDSLFAYKKLSDSIMSTLKEENGILYAMNRPIILTGIKVSDPDKETETTNLPEYYYVTPDGILINDNYIIKPKKSIFKDKIYGLKYYMSI